MSTEQTIAFIGLGRMGGPMASNLVKAGYGVRGYDSAPDAASAAAAAGVTRASSIAEAVGGADVVFTSLPDGGCVLDVYRGASGVFARARSGALLIDTSTVDIDHARAASSEATQAGMLALDAPVSGGVVGAVAAKLTFMVGGSEPAFAAAEPYFKVLGARAVHCGGAGAGTAVKLCNNLLLAIQQIGVGEAFALAQALGVDPRVFHAVGSTATGACWALNTNCPVPAVVPASPASRDYAPGFTVSLMHKDLGLALAAARKCHVHTELGARAGEVYAELSTSDLAGRDFSVVYREIVRKSGLS
jgi:3-hydroxyisobutyrate dehydrogenase